MALQPGMFGGARPERDLVMNPFLPVFASKIHPPDEILPRARIHTDRSVYKLL